jgi:predicted CoA-binding protein
MGSMRTTTEVDDIRHVLLELDTWAVVGCSSSPMRDSFEVARFLQGKGKRVVPVNPAESSILGEVVHPDLAAVRAAGIEVDVVDLFRRSEEVGRHVDEAIEIGAKAVWLQLGVIDERAAQRASDAGLIVIMDRCPKIEYPRLRL